MLGEVWGNFTKYILNNANFVRSVKYDPRCLLQYLLKQLPATCFKKNIIKFNFKW